MLSTILSFVWIGLPLGAWVANLSTGKRVHGVLLYFVTGLIGYFVLLASVWALDSELEAKMDSFDLDGNGSFSGSELTPEAELAMDQWASDTGRTFAPIFGIPLTAIWYTLLFAVVFGGEWIFRLVLRRGLPDEESQDDRKSEPTKSDNPYQPPNG